MIASLRKHVLRWVPQWVQHQAKKLYYPRLLRSVSPEDEPDVAVVRALLREGDRVADVGANIGTYTRFLSEFVGPAGRVFAVEPVPPTFDLLRRNVHKLGLANVETIARAVAASPGRVAMEVPAYDTGGRNFYRASVTAAEARGSGAYEVAAETLDRLFGDEDLAFVKVDVEGAELECLRGAAALLRSRRPAWLVEVSEARSEAVFALFAGRGYRAYRFDGTRLDERCEGDRSVNWFFLDAGHLERIRERGIAT
jgi:FkbM family methyltransferase